MPNTTNRNGLRSPLPADAPDGPGAIANLASDVEQYIGGQGTEYCANATAISAIPTSRLYVGKRAYAADTTAIWRWNGTKWQVWNWANLPYTEWVQGGQAVGGTTIDSNTGDTKLHIVEGICFLNFNLYRPASGLATGVTYLITNPNYRPQYGAIGHATLLPGSSGIGTGEVLLDANGLFSILTFQGANNPAALRGALHFQAWN